MRTWDEHWRLADRLGTTRCKWILSSYDVPQVRKLYGGYHIVPVQSFSGMKVKKNRGERVINQEVLITNFAPTDETIVEYVIEPRQVRLLET